MAENYDLIFGQSASSQYAWSDSDYQNGWQAVGRTPPTAAQFDALQRRADLKAQELNNRLAPIEENDTHDYRQPSTAYAVGNIAYHASLPTGYYLECTTGGTTSSGDLTISSPSIGGTVSDGTVVWTIRKIANTTEATTTTKGLMSAADKTKLNGVVTTDATTTTHGLMSAADKTKLNGIANNANNYSLPAATSSTRGGVKIGSNISLSGDTISLAKANITNALGYTPPTTNTTYSTGTASYSGITKLYTALGDNTDGTMTQKAIKAIVGSSVPLGAILPFAGNGAVPAGYLLCDGAAVSRTMYPDLFSVIGTTYGAGDGSTTFNVPDYNTTKRFVQGDTVAGTVKAAGLPNIKGAFGQHSSVSANGAFVATTNSSVSENLSVGGGRTSNAINFDAAKGTYTTTGSIMAEADSPYGKSDTVQPPALTTRYIIKYK